MIPVVAIVGRPNVGKSTLFNRITRSTSALVSSVPGMTRDRQYGEADINGQPYLVIDTGGLTNEPDEINELTRSQSRQAIQEASIILFVVDGRAGLTGPDKEIADYLRSISKPITLVVNKTEGLDEDVTLSEFYELGFGSLIAISASHGSGITELLDTFTAINPDNSSIEQEPDTAGIKLAIIGRPNVGKSTLTNRILGEERVIVFDQPGTTRDSIFIPLTRREKHYTLIDTAGIRRRGKIFEAVEKFSVVKTLQAIETCHVVLFVIDAREGITDQDLRLLGFIIDSGKGLVVAVNKWDGMSLEERDQTRNTLDRKLNFLSFARIHFISALHGSGVGNLFDSVNEAYASAMKKLSTSKLTKILIETIANHSPPLVHGRRVKLRYAHSGGHNPPRIVIHGNQVEALPEAYKKYLANVFQTRLKLMGTPIYIEVKNSDNPFRHQKNTLSERQQRKKRRLIQHHKKKKKER